MPKRRKSVENDQYKGTSWFSKFKSLNHLVFFLSTFSFTTNNVVGRILLFIVLLLRRLSMLLIRFGNEQNKQPLSIKTLIEILKELMKQKLSPLDTAIKLHDFKLVKYFVEIKPKNVNAVITEAGSKPLHIAVSSGATDIVKFLLQNGATVNGSNNYGFTPLHYADNEDRIEIAKILLQNGANVNASNNYGLTPLHYVYHDNEMEIAKILVQNGANINAKGNNNTTVLHYAVLEGKLEFVKLLLDNGAKINVKNNDSGFTPLQFTTDTEIAKILIQNGANIESKDKHGWTSLHHTSIINNVEMAKLLLENSANIEALDKNHRTPLFVACYENNFKVAKLLIQNGANIDAKDADGWTALYHAVIYDKTDLVEFLLKHGADVNAKDHEGKFPLFYYNESTLENKHIANLLITYGANINEKDANGNTILHDAIQEEECLYFIRQLLNCGASPNIRNLEGFTPAEYALQEHDIDLSTWKTMIMNQDSEVQSDILPLRQTQTGQGEEKNLFRLFCKNWLIINKILEIMIFIQLFYEEKPTVSPEDTSFCNNYLRTCMENDDVYGSLPFSRKRSFLDIFCYQ